MISGASPGHATSRCERFFATLTNEFMVLQLAKERAFWANRMDHPGGSPEAEAAAEAQLHAFVSDPANLARADHALAESSLPGPARRGIEGFRRLFAALSTAEPSAISAKADLIAQEARFNAGRRAIVSEVGYQTDKGFRVQGPKDLILRVQKSGDEAERKNAFEALQRFEHQVMALGLAEGFRARNRYARAMGYSDFYEFKLKTSEGLSKSEVFGVLDELEAATRAAGQRARDQVIADHGPGAGRPWNFDYAARGSLDERVEPYFPASNALLRWGRTMANLGVDFRGATLRIDLVNRPSKYNNPFMHAPSPSFSTVDDFHPAELGFTANITPGVPGAGLSFATSFHHEGGHAAHFSNNLMPGPAFATEFAPTSIAFCEVQSKFNDRLLRDPQWLARYARDVNGAPMPTELIRERVLESQRSLALSLRSMMIIPYVEKEIFELPDEQITADNMLRISREVQERLVFGPSGRPTFAPVHTHLSETSAYSHSYVLADLAVEQTRLYFLKKFGHITDNPYVGRELAERYWAPGNSVSLFGFVKNLTGEAFSPAAIVRVTARDPAELSAEIARDLARLDEVPHSTAPINLRATVIMEHGGQVITSNQGAKSFEAMADEYGRWIKELTQDAARSAARD